MLRERSLIFSKFIIFGIFLSFMSPGGLRAAVQLLENNPDRIVLEIQIPPVQWVEREINGFRATVPEIDGFDLSSEPEKPCVPVRGVLLAIPPEVRYSLKILETRPIFLANTDIPLAPVFQLSDSTARAGKNSTRPLNAFFPANWAELDREGWQRGVRLLRLQINPLRFNPVSREVVGIEYLRVAIEFSAPQSPQIASLRPSDKNPFFETVFEKTVLNYSPTREWGTRPTRFSPSKKITATPPGPAYKIEIQTEGIYHLNYTWLQMRAVDVYQLDPVTVKITHKGVEIPLRVEDHGDSQFDPGDFIEFYARPSVGDTSFFNLFSDINVYWVMWGDAPGLRYEIRPAPVTASRTIADATKVIHLEQENIYHAGDSDMQIIDTEMMPAEGWIWRFFYPGDSFSTAFTVQNLPQLPETATLVVRLHGTTLDPVNPDHHAKFVINQTEVGEIRFDDREDVFFEANFSTAALQEGTNGVKITSVGDLGATLDQFYLDWIELEIPHTLSAVQNTLDFRIPPQNIAAEFSIWNFETDGLKIYEVNHGIEILPQSLRREEELRFYVESAGINAGYFTRIKINQQQILHPGRRGINLATVDSASGAVLSIQDFDTYASKAEADTLAWFIQNLPAGTYVLAGIRDEGSSQLSDSTYRAFESVGSQFIRRVGFRDSWAIIGRKGAPIGSVPELHLPDGQGVAAVADTVLVATPDTPFHLVFRDSLDTGKRYFVSSPDNFLQPLSIRLDTLANLASPENGADFLVIYHPRFTASAQRLADYRAQKNHLRTRLVAIQDIYDEFNYGLPNPAAIQQFLIYATNHWQPPAPSAVLFWGDASWDFKMNSPQSVKTNFVPSYGQPVSDNWLVCLDGPGDFLPDLLTGRVAIETDDEGQTVVDKIMAYEQMPPAAWQKEVLFITGGFDIWEQSTFMSQSKRLNESFVIPPPLSGHGVMINKTTTQSREGEKKPEILATLNQGKLWVNFLGHAASRTWDLMFNDPDVLELQNENKYPFISSMTCHTARFANPVISCFGELFVNVPNRGAVAFWGTTGWGFLSQDDVLLQKLFPTILVDTVRVLGAATNAAKLNLWQRFGSSTININSIHQYTLIGDPLTQLVLPTQPELFIDPADIRFLPAVPVEADSVVQIKIRIQNFGLATQDSVALSLFDQDEQQVTLIQNLKIAPLGRIDSVVVRWPVRGKVGQHQLRVQVDPENQIAEVDETNNQQSVPVFVYASTLTLSKPLPFQVINQTATVLQANSPVKKSETQSPRLYEFQIDSTAEFNSPGLRYERVPEGRLVTRWPTPALVDGATYFWRCRLIEGSEIGVWETRSFTVDLARSEFGAEVVHPVQLQSAVLEHTQIVPTGISLENKPIIIEVQSAGMSDGNLARIYVNEALTMDAQRGINVAAIEPLRGEILATKSFDLWGEAADADSLAEFIRTLESGVLVCAAIKDEGSRFLNENVYLALESIGSRYCRQIGGRDCWGIIGTRGAAIGSVPEGFLKAGSGVVTIVDTLNRFVDFGTVTSPVFGPANRWNRIEFLQTIPDATTEIQHQLLGFNEKTSGWDSLAVVTATSAPLDGIDSTRYSKMQIQTRLISHQPVQSPLFQGWRIAFRPVADLATGSELLQVSPDSAITGTKISFSLGLYNAGLVFADSARVQFSIQAPGSPKTAMGPPVLVNFLPPDSMITVQQEWIATGNFNSTAVFAEVDPTDEIRELYHFNNSAQTTLFVAGDSAGPMLSVFFDGKEILDGSWVAPQPRILIRLQDNSPAGFQDSTQVTIFLDDIRLSYRDGALSLQSEPGGAGVVLQPELENGQHTLEVLAQDFARNTTYFRRTFEVAASFELRNLLNYPNPFRQTTQFTWTLTRPADGVTIKIYTIAGRLIRTLDGAPGELGFNRLAWDGRDAEGDEIANGVYLYKITARRDDHKLEQIQKLIRMK